MTQLEGTWDSCVTSEAGQEQKIRIPPNPTGMMVNDKMFACKNLEINEIMCPNL